ncbi:hypothetical protein, partial [Bradyrhizobium ivorense]|uniref:hypothetical protein n=1 Tax=Bradyrhizobium ivorense TaxID=2511166 RepID=UPI001E5E13D9
MAYPNDQKVAINLIGAFQLPLPTRSHASRTQIATGRIDKNNEICSVLTRLIATVCSRGFGGQSVVSSP